MRLRFLHFIVIGFGCALVVSAQTQTTAPERSHVERFSAPEVRAERAETDATAKRGANSDDAESLNARAYARMSLGR